MTASPADLVTGRLAACATALAGPDERLLLAVSGGPDSMALLGAAAHALAGRCAVAHVRHRQRPDDRRDAELVTSVCADLGLACRVLAAPPEAGRGVTETAARRRRYRALAAAARSLGCRLVVTAHHCDDSLETLLLQLARGHTGDRALAGIPGLRPLDGERLLLRPFVIGAMPVGRDELDAARRALDLPCVRDPTNADTTIPRNALRRLLAEPRPPLTPRRLAALQRAARARLSARMGRVAAALERHLRPEGRGSLLAREAFESAPPGEELADRLELLRLTAAALRRPRRPALRRGVLGEVQRLLARGAGRARLPALPGPLELRVSRAGLHLPHDAPDEGPPAARALRALGRTPLCW